MKFRRSAGAAARLRKARDLLAQRNGWVQNTSVLSRDGKYAYCLSGALVAVGATNTDLERVRAVIARKYGIESITVFNDRLSRRKSEVLAVVDEAIETTS